MSTFLNSPVWASIVAVVGSAVGGLILMVARVMVKVSQLTDDVSAIREDIQEIKDDKNTVRWSDIAGLRIRRR